MPRPLHWFKWQAYTTWLSGAALLLVVYYVGGRALLTDPSRAALTPGVATAVAIGGIVIGWLVYDVLWQYVAPRSATAAGVAVGRRARRDRLRPNESAQRARGLSARRRAAGDDHGRQRRADDHAVAARAGGRGDGRAACPIQRWRQRRRRGRSTTTT